MKLPSSLLPERMLVVDLVGTLAINGHGVLADSEPDYNLLSKLTYLHANGFSVVINVLPFSWTKHEHTEDEQRVVVNKWLDKHLIPHSKVVFNNSMGVAHINNKSYSSANFNKAVFYNLTGRKPVHSNYRTDYGRPSTIRIGDHVIKVEPSANLINWMRHSGYETPRILTVANDVITMTHTPGKTLTESMIQSPKCPQYAHVGAIMRELDKQYKSMNHLLTSGVINASICNTYVTKIMRSVGKIVSINDGDGMTRQAKKLSGRITKAVGKHRFSNYHGNLTCDNVIIGDTTCNQPISSYTYINPSVNEHTWYSSTLDAAKLAGSILLYTHNDMTRFIFTRTCKFAPITKEQFNLLIVCELVSMYDATDNVAEQNQIRNALRGELAK